MLSATEAVESFYQATQCCDSRTGIIQVQHAVGWTKPTTPGMLKLNWDAAVDSSKKNDGSGSGSGRGGAR